MDHFWHFWYTFVHSKCKRSSVRSQCWMRHFYVIFKHCELSKMLIRCFDPPALTSWPLLQIRDYVHAQEHDNYKYRTNLPQKSLRIDDLLLLCSLFLYCCWFSRVTTPHYENKQDAFGALVMMKSEEWLSANVSIVGCQASSSFMKLLSPFILSDWNNSLGIEIRVSTKIFQFLHQNCTKRPSFR